LRLTLTLDDDVAIALQRLRPRGNGTLEEIGNDAWRAGLAQLAGRTGCRQQLRTQVVHLGRSKLGDLDDIAEALAAAEGESFR